MLFSLALVKVSQDRYKSVKEKFTENAPATEQVQQEMSLSFGFYVFALMVLAIEITLLYYAITIAVNNSRPGINRAVHIILAVLITIPYLLINTSFINNTNANLKY